MSNQFQNRLVGTIVLVALGVIFLPDMLDGKKERTQEVFAEIPLRPAIVISKPDNHKVLDVKKLPADEPANPESDSSDIVRNEIQNEQGLKQPSTELNSAAWTVQLGTFSDVSNVQSLLVKLREQGFRAYSLPREPEQGKLTKVFVGPDISKEKITKLQLQVEKLTNLKGKVVPFNPLES